MGGGREGEWPTHLGDGSPPLVDSGEQRECPFLGYCEFKMGWKPGRHRRKDGSGSEAVV